MKLNNLKPMGHWLLAVLLFISGSSYAASKGDDNLTQAFAQNRRAQISDVSYDINLSFDKKAKTYQGQTTVKVDLKTVKSPLALDFTADKIKHIIVNGQPLMKPAIEKGRVTIPAKYLKPSNTLEIAYESKFSQDGNGLQWFEDPVDKEIYIYSDSEPYYAHTFFPCFDQPDLKAKVNLSLDIPSDWKGIGNELIKETKVSGDRQRIQFKTTPPISPYLVFVGVGAYQMWQDKFGDLPLELYARKSLAKDVDYQRLFATTKNGLKFYSEYFATPYPFSKYGQVFVPEFNWGGMENPGAVTINEREIFKGKKPQSDYEDRDDLILHEMAHMWFGDLVTMHWWDDLWLNESFASFMASLAMEREMKSELGKLGAIASNGWAFWQDQLVTTHPIETKVEDTRTAKGNFDGITYAKGQAALKQLHFYVGEENFKKGLQKYFKEYAFKNTKRADFISAIAQTSNMNLDNWTHAWLQTSGPNRVEAKWTCQDGKISQFSMEQTPSSSGTLSPHKTRVATYRSSGTKLSLLDSVDVLYSEKSTPVPALIGKKCPQFVFPNLDGLDYALFSFDPQSMVYAKKVLEGASSDPAIRLQTWQMLAQMVRDLKIKPQDYFDYAIAGLKNEKNEAVLAILLDRHSPVMDYFYSYLTPTELKQIGTDLEKAFLNRIANEKSGSNVQMNFFDFYIPMVTSDEGLKAIHGMLRGSGVPKGIELDQDRRWAILLQLSRMGFAGSEALVAAEEIKDPSQNGKRFAYSARNAIPKKEVKEKFWESLGQPNKVSHNTLKFAARSFHVPMANDLSAQFVEPFFNRVTKMDWKKNDHLVELYFENLFPMQICSQTLLKESQQKFKAAKNLTLLANRAWREANDELAKCVAIKK